MRFITLILTTALLIAPGGQEKVTICHNDTITITIGAPAVDAHLSNHGDTLGACAEGGIGPAESPLDPPYSPPIIVDPPPVTTTVPPDVDESVEPPSPTPTPEHTHESVVILRCTIEAATS